MRYSVLFTCLLLTGTMFLTALNTPSVDRKLLTSGPTQSTSLTTIDTIDRRLRVVDAYARADPNNVKVELAGTDQDGRRLVIKVKKPEPVIGAIAGAVPESNEDLIDLSILTIPETYILKAIDSIFRRDPHADSFPGVVVRQKANLVDYEVVEDYSYAYKGTTITVPKGFVYDRATIPRIFWVIVDKDSLSNVAPLFHDLLYRYGGKLDRQWVRPYREFNRADADDLFYELMGKCGVEEWRRSAAYQAVHTFAKSHWNGH